MLYTAAVREIQFKLGRRRDLAEDVKDRIDSLQDELELEANLPWFLVEKLTLPMTVLPSGDIENPMEMPEGFIREFEDGGMYVELPSIQDEGKYLEVRKTSTKHAREWASVSRGMPHCYTFHNNRIELFPQPDKSYDVILDAYVKDEKGSVAFARDGNTATNKWLTYAPQVLIESVVVAMCLDLRDQQGAEMAALRLTGAKKRLQEQNVYRMEYNQLRTLGEDN